MPRPWTIDNNNKKKIGSFSKRGEKATIARYMWSVASESINQGPKEGDWERQADELSVCVTKAMLLVNWHVALHLIKSSNVVEDGSFGNVGATSDSAVEVE